MTGPRERHSQSLDWQDDAACAGMDTELFYGKGNGPIVAEVRAACARCPVTAECLDFAMGIEGDVLHTLLRHGVWGGTSAVDRLNIARRRRRGELAQARALNRKETA